jgi:transposase
MGQQAGMFYVGLDVSVARTSVCIIDAAGQIVLERSIASTSATKARAKSDPVESEGIPQRGPDLIQRDCWTRRPAVMAKPLSEDLRFRLIAAVDDGMSRRAAAERFGMAATSVVRWVQAWRATGATRTKPQGGDKRSHRIEAYREVILAAIDAQVDITLVELADMLRREYGASFAPSTVWRFPDRHAMTIKRNGARQRTGTAQRRRAAQGLVQRAARPRP